MRTVSTGDGVSAGNVGTAGQVGSAVPIGTAGFDLGYDTARLMPPATLGDYEQLRQQPAVRTAGHGFSQCI